MEVHEIFVSGDTPEWDAMTARTGGRTTPQILINEEVIGGYDGLYHKLPKSRKVESHKPLIFRHAIFTCDLKNENLRHIWTRPAMSRGTQEEKHV